MAFVGAAAADIGKVMSALLMFIVIEF